MPTILVDDSTPRKDPLAQGRTALLGDAVRPQPRNLGAAPANEGVIGRCVGSAGFSKDESGFRHTSSWYSSLLVLERSTTCRAR